MTSHPASIADKRRTFHQLHASGCFVIPNPWDLGSARYLQSLGFKALATTSSGFAWSRARADNHVTRDTVLAHLSEIVGAECFLVGRPDLAETIARLKAYANAGADCLYAPGLRTPEHIRAVVDAVAPKPVNLLIGWASDMRVDDVAALGVRRISVGGALARSAWGGFMRTAKAIAEHGRFDGFADAASGAELNALFGGGA